MPVVGPRGIIEVTVSPKGVESFVRNFRLPSGPAGPPKRVISAEEVLISIAAARQQLFSDQDPGQIISMQLAYLNSGPEEGLEPLVPVWAVEFDLGHSIVVNAYTGAAERRVAP
jgi:hypothetical protein